MRFSSLSNGPTFTRRLSVQPETEETNGDGESDDVPLQPVTVGSCPNPSTFHGPSPPPPPPLVSSGEEMKHYSSDIDEDMDIVEMAELRKLSVTSMTSIKSSSSISSTCSAPGGISSSIGGGSECSAIPKKGETYAFNSLPKRKLMTSRPSFISLCSIVSETSESPVVAQRMLPAPLQVELDFMQRSGIEGDYPVCRSHLPILRCPSDYDINEMELKGDWTNRKNCNKKGLVNGIKQFPKRMRKLSTEKNKFDLYEVSDDVREQLKQLYVY